MKLFKHSKILFLLPLAALLCACATSHVPNEAVSVDTSNFQQIANVTESSVGSSALGGNHLRLKAVSQAALTLGAQSGLAYETKKLNNNMLDEAEHLRTIFNFDALILNHNILPPVLVESKNNLNLDNNETIRTSARSFKIMQSARFVTAPPTWRNFLFMTFKTPDLPDQTLLPRDASEQSMWRAELKKGWQSGVSQADQIFSENLASLKQDYEGMILYRKLLAEHMVTPPYVSSTSCGFLRVSAFSGVWRNRFFNNIGR